MKIRLPARLFRAGSYPDKKYTADAATLDRIVAATRGAAGSLPMDLHHADTDETFDLGNVPAASVRREGDWILGDVEVEDTDLPRFKSRGLSVKIDRATNAISKVTVTGSPRILGAGFSDDGGTDGDALEFSGGYLMDPKDQAEPTAEATSAAAPAIDEEAVGNIVTRTLRKLFGGNEPTAEPALLSNDAIDRAVAKAMTTATAEFDAKLKTRDEEIKALREQSAEFSDARIATEVTAAIIQGVPPVIAENMIPLAFGRDEITFSDDKGVPQKRTAAEAAKLVLEFATGKLPKGGQLGLTTGSEAVSFDSRSANRADAIKAEHPEFSIAKCQELADAELTRKEA